MMNVRIPNGEIKSGYVNTRDTEVFGCVVCYEDEKGNLIDCITNEPLSKNAYMFCNMESVLYTWFRCRNLIREKYGEDGVALYDRLESENRIRQIVKVSRNSEYVLI